MSFQKTSYIINFCTLRKEYLTLATYVQLFHIRFRNYESNPMYDTKKPITIPALLLKTRGLGLLATKEETLCRKRNVTVVAEVVRRGLLLYRRVRFYGIGHSMQVWRTRKRQVSGLHDLDTRETNWKDVREKRGRRASGFGWKYRTGTRT